MRSYFCYIKNKDKGADAKINFEAWPVGAGKASGDRPSEGYRFRLSVM
jgi:hypothetical protein